MLHPLLLLLSSRTQLLAEHAEGYAALVAAEAGVASAIWKRNALLHALALCTFGAAAVLTGVALMLWATVPPQNIQAPWALWAAPLLPAVMALVCTLLARLSSAPGAFSQLRQQLKADMALLAEASQP